MVRHSRRASTTRRSPRWRDFFADLIVEYGGGGGGEGTRPSRRWSSISTSTDSVVKEEDMAGYTGGVFVFVHGTCADSNTSLVVVFVPAWY